MNELVVVKPYIVYGNSFNCRCYNRKSIISVLHEMKVGKPDYLLLFSREDESPRS